MNESVKKPTPAVVDLTLVSLDVFILTTARIVFAN